MTRFPRIAGEQMIRYLIKKGFSVTRQKGSHVSLRTDKLFTSVPKKNSRLGVGLIFTILGDAEISKDEFVEDYESGLV